MKWDRVADSDGASISVTTVVLAVAAAAAAAAAVNVAAVTVPIRSGKAGEGTSSIVTQRVEGDIDVNVESTGEGEDHVPRDFCGAYSDDCLQSWSLDLWVVASLLSPSLTLTPRTHSLSTVAFYATVSGRLGYPSSSSDSD